jgi:hypothetical protein
MGIFWDDDEQPQPVKRKFAPLAGSGGLNYNASSKFIGYATTSPPMAAESSKFVAYAILSPRSQFRRHDQPIWEEEENPTIRRRFAPAIPPGNNFNASSKFLGYAALNVPATSSSKFLGYAVLLSPTSTTAVGTITGTSSVNGVPLTVHFGTIAGSSNVQGVSSVISKYPILFPPATPTTLQNIIGSYLYTEYNDDDNLQSLVAAYNAYTQAYLDWFNNIYLPIYPNGTISGSLLDWVAWGLYGIHRPGLPSGGKAARGPFNTWAFNTTPFNTGIAAVAAGYIATTDDTFKRIITWLFYKGDGKVFTVKWLKRRVARYLAGANGNVFDIDQTYNVSVTFTGAYAATITIPAGPNSTILQAAVNAGVLELPFQITWTVVT